MKRYNGFIKRKKAFTGTISEDTTAFTGQIECQDTPIRATITPIIPVKAVLRGKFFRGVIRLIDTVFRPLHSVVSFFAQVKYKLGKAPATDGKADASIRTVVEMKPQASPAAVTSAKRGIIMGVLVGVAAVARAAITFIVQLPLSRTARLTRANGVVIPKYEEATRQKWDANAIAAAGIDVESQTNKIRHAYDATAIAAAVQFVDLDVATGNAAAAAMDAADVLPVGVAVGACTSGSGKMAYWIDPDLQGGVLMLRQSYAASANGGTLEVV